MMTVDDWMPRIFTARSESEVSAAFQELEERLRACACQDPVASEILERMGDNARETDPMLLVASLRLTFMSRTLIRGWKRARIRIATALKTRGYDPKQLLRGL